jgi:hypothetical protein
MPKKLKTPETIIYACDKMGFSILEAFEKTLNNGQPRKTTFHSFHALAVKNTEKDKFLHISFPIVSSKDALKEMWSVLKKEPEFRVHAMAILSSAKMDEGFKKNIIFHDAENNEIPIANFTDEVIISLSETRIDDRWRSFMFAIEKDDKGFWLHPIDRFKVRGEKKNVWTVENEGEAGYLDPILVELYRDYVPLMMINQLDVFKT